jgi:hypothetical protein
MDAVNLYSKMLFVYRIQGSEVVLPEPRTRRS